VAGSCPLTTRLARPSESIAIVSYASMFTTLRPGDLIVTGTPSGAASAEGQAPGRY
jgi:Fumarylacetoacetate (FAA) hydrolase family